MKTERRLDRQESKLRPLYPESELLLIPSMPWVNYKISALGGEITNSSHSEQMNYPHTLLWEGTAMGLPQFYLHASPLSNFSPSSEHHFFILPNIGLSFSLSHGNLFFSFTAFTPTQNYTFIIYLKEQGLSFILLIYAYDISEALSLGLTLVSCHPNKLFFFSCFVYKKAKA